MKHNDNLLKRFSCTMITNSLNALCSSQYLNVHSHLPIVWARAIIKAIERRMNSMKDSTLQKNVYWFHKSSYVQYLHKSMLHWCITPHCSVRKHHHAHAYNHTQYEENVITSQDPFLKPCYIFFNVRDLGRCSTFKSRHPLLALFIISTYIYLYTTSTCWQTLWTYVLGLYLWRFSSGQ